MTETELRQAVAVTHPIKPRVLPRPHQVTRRLILATGHRDRLQQSTRKQQRELTRIALVGLDPIPRPARHQPRRHHPTLDPTLYQVPVQAKPGRPRLITTRHTRPPRQCPLNRDRVIRKRPLVQQLVTAHRGQPNRRLVHIQPDANCPILTHGRRPPYVALPGHPGNPRHYAGADHHLNRQTHAPGRSILS